MIICLKPHLRIIQTHKWPNHHIEWRLIVWDDDRITKKYGENDANEAYQLNLYTMANHSKCRSQSLIWPFWKPYLGNCHFTIYTIHLANSSTSRWSCEMVQWSINAFSHNFLKFPQNSIPWLVRTSTWTLNPLNVLSKNAYVVISILRFGNGINSKHLEKYLIITKTYWLCWGVKLNGPIKSKIHW